MGRPNKRVYEYDFDGNFIRKHESIAEFRRCLYTEDAGIRPIFVNKIKGYDFHITPQNTVAMTERIYRDNIVFFLRIYNSKLCRANTAINIKKPIQMFNLNNEVIAEFSSLTMAGLLLNDEFKIGTIYNQLNSRINSGTTSLVKDFYFQYKKA